MITNRTSAVRRLACSLIAGMALQAGGLANAQKQSADLLDAVAKGSPILELRPRSEYVEQGGRPNDGEATTLRTPLGWQTSKWNGLQALIEFEDVHRIGPENYHTSLNGRTSYDLGFLSAEATVTHGPVSVRVAHDELEGNGTRGFSTPLGSLHAFNGWSDAFISNGAKTTVDGLRDANATLTWATGVKWDYLSNLVVTARYHNFEAERTGVDLGSELDLMATGNVTPQLSWLVKFADYDGPGAAPAPTDRTKIWFGFEWKM